MEDQSGHKDKSGTVRHEKDKFNSNKESEDFGRDDLEKTWNSKSKLLPTFVI